MLLMEVEAGLCSCPSLKRILSAGEALTASLARQAARVLPHVALVNAYGPTEATVYITHHTFDPKEANARPTVSIGKPLTNSKCYVVDKKNVSLGFGSCLAVVGAARQKGKSRRISKSRLQ